MKTHHGHCHCGAVQYDVQLDLESAHVLACNCSHCAIKGFILTFVPEAQFTLTQGEAALTEYRFNKGHIEHLFCTTCGVESFARGKDQGGSAMAAINLRCVDDIDISTLTITPFDGKNMS